MKRHLNTLFVTTQRTWLRKEGDTVQVRFDGETLLQIPLLTLAGIVCFGNIRVSPYLLGRCGERGIAVSFLSIHGRFLARVSGPTSGNVLLRREQYRRADDLEASAAVARSIVAAKIANSRTVVQRALRDHPAEDDPADGDRGQDPRTRAIDALAALGLRLGESLDLDAVRGVEGAAGRAYFGAMDALVRHDDDAFCFTGRSRRPPEDPFNALLSFIYTLLLHDVLAAVESVGLDPQVGFLHRDRPGRPSLALDLMEELRAPLADRLVLSLINRRQVEPGGFERLESGGWAMDEDTRKTVLVAWQERKQDEIRHPFLEERTTIGLLPHLQALLFARHLRGDLDAYPPFIGR